MQFHIHVHNLDLMCLIGIDPHEQGVPQRVRFNIDVTLHTEREPLALGQTVPYDAIVRHLKAMSHMHIDLAETYVAKIAEYCLTFPAAFEVFVRLDKLDAFPEAAGVGASVRMVRA
jgi:7,8-dihydroneopterin aldolase/epimerase/oxygenase